MEQIVKDVLLKAKDIKKSLSNRQIEIRRLISRSDDSNIKDELDTERKSNSNILRILEWIIMCIKGFDLQKRLERDPSFCTWLSTTVCIYVFDSAAELLNIKSTRTWHFKGWSYVGFYNRLDLYKQIIYALYENPDNGCGIFDIYDQDESKKIIMRDCLLNNLKIEYQKCKNQNYEKITEV